MPTTNASSRTCSRGKSRLHGVGSRSSSPTIAAFERLRADPGRVGLESLLEEVEKLNRLRELALPKAILKPFHPELVKRFRRRAATESAWELARHPAEIRLPLIVFYCVPREAELVDALVELLLQITHRMTVRAERRVIEELLGDVRYVRGKTSLRCTVDDEDGD